jgi:hypothetical protein
VITGNKAGNGVPGRTNNVVVGVSVGGGTGVGDGAGVGVNVEVGVDGANVGIRSGGEVGVGEGPGRMDRQPTMVSEKTSNKEISVVWVRDISRVITK